MRSSFTTLLHFEAYYFVRQPAFIVGIVIALVFGYFLSGKVVISGNVFFFSAHNLTYFSAMLSLPSLFAITLLSSSTLLRDKSCRFVELVCAAPISTMQLQLSRYVGLFLASLTVAVITLVCYLMPALLSPEGEQVFGSLSLTNTLWPVLLFLVPNTLFTCAALFFFSQFINKTIGVYLIGLAIYVFYMSVTAYFDSPMFIASKALQGQQLAITSIVDPFAISAFLEQTQFWSIDEKNTQGVSLTGSLLINRVVWLTISLILILLTLNKASSPSTASKKGKDSDTEKESSSYHSKSNSPASEKTIKAVYSGWSMFKRSLAIEFSSTFFSVPFALLVLLTAVLVVGQFIASIELNSVIGAQYAYTSLLAPIIVTSLKIVSIVTVAFYSAELAYRARDVKFHEVLLATPISRWSLYLSQLTTLCLLVISLLVVAITCAIGYQILNGFYDIDWMLYGSLFPIYAMPMLYLAVLCMTVQFAVTNKYLGILSAVLLMAVFGTSLGSNMGLEHVLLKFSSLATIRYSDFNGFGYFWHNITALLVHWGLYAGVLLFLGFALFSKTLGQGNFNAIVTLSKKLNTWQRSTMFALCGAAVFSTAYVYWNTNEINSYQTTKGDSLLALLYEQEFTSYRDKNAPLITDIKADIAFYPNDYALTVMGELTLENTRASSISEFIISVPDKTALTEIDVQGASSIEHITEFNTFKVKLASPLKMNERLVMQFSSKLSRTGFKNRNSDVTLISNGSYFHSEALFPYIGFNPAMGVVDSEQRKRLGLSKIRGREKLVANKQYDEHLKKKDANLVTFEAIVSTSRDQIAVAPGDLIKRWNEKDRTFFHYKVTKPTSNFFGFSSARYKTYTQTMDGHRITLYYHPTHNTNIEQMMKTARLSLKTFSEDYAPYPFEQLTIAEIPYRGFARAYPGTIFFSENAGFKENLTRKNNLDDFSSIVAHEIAHQWWGHQLKTANAEGATLLIESLAEYSALTIMRKLYGDDYVHAELQRASSRYLAQRGQIKDQEPALYVMNDERYLRYEKGLVALYAIAQKVGEDSFNDVLRKLLSAKAFARRDFTTNLDFLSLFEGHKHALFISNWLTRVMLYDLTLSDAAVTAENTGKYTVSAVIRMSEIDHTNSEQGDVSASDQTVDYVIYAQNPDGKQPIHTGQVQLIEGEAQLTLSLDDRPTKITLDPYQFYTDRNLLDNTAVFPTDS